MGVRVKGIRESDGSSAEVVVSERKGEGISDLILTKALKFEFSFDTPNLDTGVDIYTPKVGDLLYNLWFDVLTPFDGNPVPSADVSVTPNSYGLQGSISDAYRLDDPSPSPNGMSNDTRTGKASILAAGGTNRCLPARFISEDPLKLYVTKEGRCDGSGTPIDSTEGRAFVLAIICPTD